MKNVKQTIMLIIRRNKILYTVYANIFSKIINWPRRKKKIKSIQVRGFELLEEIHNTLEYNNIKFFVDFGTLLGFIREKGFIKNDMDIDLGVINENSDTPFKVKDILLNMGSILKHEYIYRDKIVEHSFLYKQIKYDICYYDQDTSSSNCYLFYREAKVYSQDTMSVVRMNYDLIEGIEKYNIGKYKFNIPKNSLILLQQKYGDDWKTPNSKWTYWKAPTAVKCEEPGILKEYE